MDMASSSWTCDRSTYLKSLLPASSPILVSSGGGIDLKASLGSWATSCPAIDIVSVHDYGTDPSSTVPALVAAAKGVAAGKRVMLGEWGISGPNKASTIAKFVSMLKEAGMPWMIWEVVKPGKSDSDLEVRPVATS